MKNLVLNRNIIVSIFVVMLMYGVQGVSYAQDAPTVTPGETNTSLIVEFEITLDEGVDENAYQIQLRRKSPQGEWTSKCVVIQRGNRRHIAGDPDVFGRAVYIHSRVIFVSGNYSDNTFRIKAIFTKLEPGATYEARYRDTNVLECTENPPNPDPWSHVAEGTVHLVAPSRAEFVDANLAKQVRYELRLDTEGGHINLLHIPQAELVKLTELESDDAEITDITGLEHATQLVDLDLSDNQISDISPLAQLTQLTDLDLSYNQISDLSPLAQLTRLTELHISRNPITDISPLRTIFPTIVVIEPDIETEKHLSIYWEDGYQIRRMDFANSHVQDIITEGTRDVEDIALDITNRKIYYANSRDIKRANLNGTDAEDVIGGLYDRGLALDVSAGKIYWGDDDLNGNIKRANLDGTDLENVVKIEKWLGNIALDAVGGKIYWTTYYDGGIWRANLDGTEVQSVVNVGGWPTNIALDVVDGKMYWIDDLKDKIRRVNLDGTDVQDVVTNLFADGLALDVSAGKIYWTEWGRIGFRDGGRIRRANLDGNHVEDVVTGLHYPTGLVLNTLNTKDTKVSITPASVASPAIGEQITFNLPITGGEAVAGYQATVQFDTTALRYVSGANGDFLPAGAFFVEPTVEGNHVKLNAASLAGESNGDGTLATLTFEVIAAKASTLMLSDVLLTDSAGETFVPRIENAEITEPSGLKGDVNGDGTVNIADLVLVAGALGKTGQHAADVNGDSVVNIADLVLVAGALGNSAAAPSLHLQSLDMLTTADVKMWLSQAQQFTLTDATSQRGIIFLEQLLKALTPKETALLPNYPNPFNPETWIPYHLAKSADVTLTIYAADGQEVRQLSLGHQPAGMYYNRSRAAYWDGRNEVGEPVASGVYFYTLTAGDFTATRKMLIRK